jgi:hypothetical protein
MTKFNQLINYLNENAYSLVRFFFYLDNTINSVTFSTNNLIQQKFIPYEKEILFDLSTGFSHPTSLQLTYCLFASLNEDIRQNLSHQEEFFLAKIYFSLDENSSWQDFRSEILLEGEKAGLELLNHTSQGSKLIMELSATSQISLADSLEKFKIIAEALAQSYAREINWEPSEYNLIIKKQKNLDKFNRKSFYKAQDCDIFYQESINCNSYQLVKKLCGSYYY